MNAQDARKRALALQQQAAAQEQAAAEQLQQLRAAAVARGEADAPRMLPDIMNKIAAAANRGNFELCWTVTSSCEKTGQTYLQALAVALEGLLEAAPFNYQVTSNVRYNSRQIYEGTMNPEWVGSEFVDVALQLHITW
jgi:hypothetical protein